MEKEKEEKKELYGAGYLVRNFGKKHRISIRDQKSDTEVWYMYISAWRILIAILAVLVLMFVAVIAIVVYTPVLDRLPGNPGIRSRELLMENIQRLDSLENELNYLQAYNRNVTLIMEGRIPEASVDNEPASVQDPRAIVAQSLQDSLLRLQLEGSGRYGLNTQSPALGAGGMPVTFFASPVEGAVTSDFNPASGMYGIGYTIAEPQQVVAAREGTVIMSMWTPSDDYIIQVQHKDNMISIYKRNSQLMKGVGDHVDEGEAIGYVNVSGGGDGPREFIFEIWYDGRPVDPKSFISY